jgi:deoxyhypusine synthase
MQASNRQFMRCFLSVMAGYGSYILQRNGADYSLYINTGQEFEGSDSGARLDEVVSWGKSKARAQGVKACNLYASTHHPNTHFILVFAGSTLVFPLLVVSTFVNG